MALVVGMAAPVHAGKDPDVDTSENPYVPEVLVGGEQETAGSDAVVVSEDGDVATREYSWLPACFDNRPGNPLVLCASAYTCTGETEVRWNLWAREIAAGSSWSIIASACFGEKPEAVAPIVTDERVLEAVRRLGLPRLTVRVQPIGETLVNFETIFYAEPREWVRTVRLLGHSVEVEASAASYEWVFGDGSAMSTEGPGAPYPAAEVVHEYADAHVLVRPRVDVAYAISYRVDGGGWRSVEETVPAAGLPVRLRIREATALLVGD